LGGGGISGVPAIGAIRWSFSCCVASPYGWSGAALRDWAGPPSVLFEWAPGPETGAGL